MRKIIHVDMDAFYASVEQRDDPSLRGRPVVVAWKGARSVVCAASYEARKFGVRSAMPALRAERLCPDAVFVPPDFTRYKAVSRQVREIFHRQTDLVEPLSLDEAYLDVTEAKSGMRIATEIARQVRAQIREETQLTASAGIAPNKFLAKIASDWRKPDGQFVVPPSKVEAFLTPLPVNRIPGVGKVMESKLTALGIHTVGDLRVRPLEELQAHFGSFGQGLYNRARGIDERPVEPHQEVQQVSSEDTFAEDLPLEALAPEIARLAERTWAAIERTGRLGRTVVLKLKTSQFRILTRSLTPERPPASAQELVEIAQALVQRVQLPDSTRYRLVGVGVSGFAGQEEDVVQGDLFAGETLGER
ncbi:DNA polymerase IV [Stenotrophomonas sp. HITSZ_GD]|uniref:DNA polymerase IV n=1 Tax=Stenotrophomonas sp. HITSZ_GD TaxID=3037248 RepID=UPI00240DF5BD|nr:DNA polymerase IV [Stenotrophomonas sp. HITSZ_GD]MDG2525614.1 DNA polymerase IV [Stenotrophomonas sp. HITSZ_GD]